MRSEENKGGMRRGQANKKEGQRRQENDGGSNVRKSKQKGTKEEEE